MKLKSKTHGYLDYLVAVLLIAAPWLFGFYRGGTESWVPIILGVTTIVYSLLTNYELGAFRVIPFNVHLGIDVLSGIFLAASPWLFNFADYVYVPHLVVGLLEIGVATFTKSKASSVNHQEMKGRYNTADQQEWSHSH